MLGALQECDDLVHVRAQVFQGLILASRDRFSREAPPGGYGGSVTDGAGYLGALWGHECGRVFCDKMNTPKDKAWVEGAIADLARHGVVATHTLGFVPHTLLPIWPGAGCARIPWHACMHWLPGRAVGPRMRARVLRQDEHARGHGLGRGRHRRPGQARGCCCAHTLAYPNMHALAIGRAVGPRVRARVLRQDEHARGQGLGRGRLRRPGQARGSSMRAHPSIACMHAIVTAPPLAHAAALLLHGLCIEFST